jgi:nicotinate (nicotinamide) nucleotide adenylyltransferase
LLFEGEDYVAMEKTEIENQGPNYTIDTVFVFKKKYNLSEECRLDIIIGDDLLPELHTWKSFSQLRQHVRFVCFTRVNKKKYTNHENILFLNNSTSPFSSSKIREELSVMNENAIIKGLNSEQIKYILEHKLFQ